MAFKTRKKEEFSYSSPQEMYQDNKFKKIMGPLDYQAAMLNLYNENADKKIKISSKPNAVTIEAIKEVQQMKSGAVTDKTSYDDVDKMISDILDN